jgi:hypothetical protein
MDSTSQPIFKDCLSPQGLVELFVTRGRPVIHKWGKQPSRPGYPDVYSEHRLDFTDCIMISKSSQKNIIVNYGKDSVIRSLTTGNILTLARMAVGDRGTIPSDSTVPKVPVPTMTALYNEVARADAEAVILNVGTPTVHEVKLVKTFSAVDIPITAFSNQAKPVLNEVGLIMIDPSQPPPLPRPPVFGPYTPVNLPPADEVLFSIRTFKSVPFEVANDMSVTIRYTIYIE